METYLPLLLHLQPGLELQEWLPSVLQQYWDLRITPDQVLEHPDIHVINPANETLKIEQVRELQAISSFSPYQLPHSVFVIQQLETASLAAQNALLKILEEPPAGVSLIVTSAHPDRILATIRSRCRLVFWEAPSDSKASEDANSDITALYAQIMKAAHGDLILLTESYADRVQATQVVTQLIDHLHQTLYTPAAAGLTQTYVQQLEILLQTNDWLKKNVNVKLALTECFFQLHAKQPILRP